VRHLVVGDRQVQVATVLRQGAGERDDLERALPGGMLGAAGEPQPGLRQAADATQHPARADPFAGGERRQLDFEVGAGTQPNRYCAHAARLPPFERASELGLVLTLAELSLGVRL
jgi:hypothetical protein